jgi:hypothetical protein
MKKDFNRGEGCNCLVLGEGNAPADHKHVSRATPLDTKRKEVMGDPQYAAMNKAREKRTTALRRDKEIKPI